MLRPSLFRASLSKWNPLFYSSIVGFNCWPSSWLKAIRSCEKSRKYELKIEGIKSPVLPSHGIHNTSSPENIVLTKFGVKEELSTLNGLIDPLKYIEGFRLRFGKVMVDSTSWSSPQMIDISFFKYEMEIQDTDQLMQLIFIDFVSIER